MTDEELKALVAANAQGLSALQLGINEMRVGLDEMRVGLDELKQFQQTEAREWRQRTDQQTAEWRIAMRESYEDMVTMLRQFAEEAATDRQAIQDMVQAMFKHQSNGGGNA